MATVTIPSNENGLVFDPAINAIITEAIDADPFGFEDVIIYSHGWSTNADNALDDYDIFSIGLSSLRDRRSKSGFTGRRRLRRTRTAR